MRGETAARSVRAAAAAAHWVADITHTLWAEGHPGTDHPHGRRAWSNTQDGEKKVGERIINLQQRAALLQ